MFLNIESSHYGVLPGDVSAYLINLFVDIVSSFYAVLPGDVSDHLINLFVDIVSSFYAVLPGDVSDHLINLFVDIVSSFHAVLPGDVSARFSDDQEESVRCDVTEPMSGQFMLSLLPTQIGLHRLHVIYDGSQVPGE